jgi:hypothetical protein
MECVDCDIAGEPLCTACERCTRRCCPFGGDVCEQCGGHLEGLDVPGGLYCEECACTICGELYDKNNVPIGDEGCSSCVETEYE